MPFPIKGLRATLPATVDQEFSLRRRILPSEALDHLPLRSTSWKKLISSISTSLAVHTAMLFVLSLIYFDIPSHKVFETILTLVVGDNKQSGDVVEVHLGELTEPLIDELQPMMGIGNLDPELMALPDDVEPSALMNLNSDSISGGDRIRNGKKVEATPKKIGLKRAMATKSQTDTGTVAEAEGQLHADHFVGRTSKGKAALLKRMGGDRRQRSGRCPRTIMAEESSATRRIMEL